MSQSLEGKMQRDSRYMKLRREGHFTQSLPRAEAPLDQHLAKRECGLGGLRGRTVLVARHPA